MPAQWLALAGNVVFVGAMMTISVRLLLLWRRTRQWPELLISSGLLTLALLVFPLFAASGLGGDSVAGVNRPILGLGFAAFAVGIGLLQAFTWQVFRPDSKLALGFVLASVAGAVLIAWLLMHALSSAPADAVLQDVHAPYSVGIRLLFEVWYLWLGFESLLEWQRARRRLALGLSDPVAVNRFLLWGSMGVILALNGAVAMALEARGMNPMKDTLPALWLAMNGAVAGTLMFMTFVPPARYVAWVRRRHEAATT